MICDYQTDKVYLAEGIKGYPKVAERLLFALYSEGIKTEYLRHTESKKHVWVRDYMPIQRTKTRFVRYRYAPDYLDGYPEYIPEYQKICRGLRLKTDELRLVVDGGNVVKFRNKVVMTDKVFAENNFYSEKMVRSKLEDAFSCEVCIIPWDRYEMFGHADGMVRSIGDNYALMNHYVDFDKPLGQKVRQSLEAAGIYVEELHYDLPRPSRYAWAYLNFLQVAGCIFVPGLGGTEDDLALQQIQNFYPQHKVVLVPDCLELVRDGGALNCVTWNVYSGISRPSSGHIPTEESPR